jgi:response regulator RpfG family c-di-GMP phosphodiesterase
MVDHDALQFAPEPPATPDHDTSPWKIAVVDDDDAIRAITRLALGRLRVDGRPVALLEAASADEGIALFAAHPDIALGLIDMVMEDAEAGLRLVREVRGAQRNRRVRLVVRTGQPGEQAEESLVRDNDISDYREKTDLTAARLRTLALGAIRGYRDLSVAQASYRGAVDLLAEVLEYRVEAHQSHARATAALASALAELAGLAPLRAEALRHAALLHDIGLLELPAPLRHALLDLDPDAVPEGGPLREHPLAGARLLARLPSEEGRLAARLAAEHHERWDGAGYPSGLAGEAIDVESRLLAVANVLDLIASRQEVERSPTDADARPAAALDPAPLRTALLAAAGTALDPAFAQLAAANLDALLAVRAGARTGPA